MRVAFSGSSRTGAEDKGFALLIVLWTVVLLALLVTHLTAAGRSEARLAGNLQLEAMVEAAADGAVMEAIFHAIDTSDRHWSADGTLHRLAFRGASVVVRIENEAGRINPSTVQPELFEALLHAVGVDARGASSITGAVVAWRFPTSQAAPGRNDTAYLDAGRSYGPPGAAFESVRELGLVLGMTPDVLARIAPFLSVYHDGEPDARSAASPVLRAIREATGQAPSLPPGAPPENLMYIVATATGQDGGMFVRDATVRIGARSRGAGLYQVLDWSAP